MLGISPRQKDDPLTGTDQFTPAAGNMLINEATAPGNWVWTQLDSNLTLPVEVQPGDRCIWNADGAGYWELIPGGSGGGTVIELDGTYPITIDDSVNGTAEEPIVEIAAAKRTDGSAPVDKADLTPNGGAVIALAAPAMWPVWPAAAPRPTPTALLPLICSRRPTMRSLRSPIRSTVTSAVLIKAPPEEAMAR